MTQVSKNIAHGVNSKPRTPDVAFDDSVTFEDLRLKPLVLKGLKDAGFEKPSPIQLKSIPLGKCGFDLVVQAKSGTGKTCVFTVLILENIITSTDTLQALVLAPTREIAVQIWEVISRVGKDIPDLKCHAFIGGLSLEDDKKNMKNCHIAIATPGRMKHLIEQEATGFEHVRFLVLDEADRLLDDNFQDNIIWIYKHLPESKQMLALSATYPENLARHVTRFMESAMVVRLNSNDPALLGINQYYKVVPHHYNQHEVYYNKRKALIKILNTINFKQCLVFSNYQLRSESIGNDLTQENFPTSVISANMNQNERLESIKKLKEFQCRILVSTDLTCRGIDAEFVDLVINFDVPICYETYLHRIGRGGRFGSYSAAITLVTGGQEVNALARIERLSNTRIACLPDPMPTDITSNPSIMSKSEITSISSYLGIKRFDELPNVEEIKEDSMIKSKNDECNVSTDASQINDLNKNNNNNNNDDGGLQKTDVVNYGDLMKQILGLGNPIQSSSRLPMTDLYNKFISNVGVDNEGEHSRILDAIKRVERLDEIKSQALKSPTNCTLGSKIDISKLVKECRSKHCVNDTNLYYSLAKVLPKKQEVLRKIFKPAENGSEDAADNKEPAADDIKEISSAKITSSSKVIYKYSRKELLDIRKSLPEGFCDISHLNQDMNLLAKVKRGEYKGPSNPYKKKIFKKNGPQTDDLQSRGVSKKDVDTILTSRRVSTNNADTSLSSHGVSTNNADTCIPSLGVSTNNADTCLSSHGVSTNNADTCLSSHGVSTSNADTSLSSHGVSTNDADTCLPSFGVSTNVADTCLSSKGEEKLKPDIERDNQQSVKAHEPDKNLPKNIEDYVKMNDFVSCKKSLNESEDIRETASIDFNTSQGVTHGSVKNMIYDDRVVSVDNVISTVLKLKSKTEEIFISLDLSSSLSSAMTFTSFSKESSPKNPQCHHHYESSDSEIKSPISDLKQTSRIQDVFNPTDILCGSGNVNFAKDLIHDFNTTPIVDKSKNKEKSKHKANESFKNRKEKVRSGHADPEVNDRKLPWEIPSGKTNQNIVIQSKRFNQMAKLQSDYINHMIKFNKMFHL